MSDVLPIYFGLAILNMKITFLKWRGMLILKVFTGVLCDLRAVSLAFIMFLVID